MFNMKIGFSIIGVIIFSLPMLVNIVYFVLPATNAMEQPASTHKIAEMIEQVTRMLYMVAICFLVSKTTVNFKSPLLYIGAVFLVLYYVVWIRYFLGGCDTYLLGKSFLLVPIPLAVFPVLYFLFVALWLHNYIAAVLMAIFGVAHYIVSYSNFS